MTHICYYETSYLKFGMDVFTAILYFVKLQIIHVTFLRCMKQISRSELDIFKYMVSYSLNLKQSQSLCVHVKRMFRLALYEVLLFLSGADSYVIVCFGLNPYPFMVICILVVVGCCVLIPLILVPLSRYLCKETRSRGKIIRRNPGMYMYAYHPILNCLQIMQYEVFLYPEW